MTEKNSAGFLDGVLDLTLGNLRAAWRDIATSARSVIDGSMFGDADPSDATVLRQQMRECLEGRGGEVSARARAAALGRTYLGLSPAGRIRFLHILAEDFGLDRTVVESCCTRLVAAASVGERAAAERALRRALETPRSRLLTQFNALPEGVKFLVDMRAEILRLAKDFPALEPVEQDLKSLLASWFDIGFLELRRITWESSAALLEKLIVYEAVHEIRGWTDLKNRLEADRRCFAFFHPRMPDEPLIFVEVALVAGMADNVHGLLDEAAPVGDPRSADTAIFYSISNCQRGLAGISFGNFLIKRVVDVLAAELPGLATFATLSPIPGLRAWLETRLAAPGDGILSAAELKALRPFADPSGGEVDPAAGGALLKSILARRGWHADPALAAAAKAPLVRLCAEYLLLTKARGGRALDPVAHFHLSNGARIERINFLGDVSERGLQQSAGLMVNYLYRLDEIEANHEAYSADGSAAASTALRAVVKPLLAREKVRQPKTKEEATDTKA